MSKGIEISKNHGVNPTIPVCFWCGKEKNEIALLGKLPGDKEAPMSAVINYEPCDDCKENMSKGITVIEATDKVGEHPEMQKGVVPTGRWLVFTEDWFKRNITNEVLLKTILVKRKVFMTVQDFTPFAERSKEIEEERKDGE